MDHAPKPPLTNRSMPAAAIIPVLAYEDVGQAVDWLCRVFGFTEHLRIGNHRAQLAFGDGAVIVTAQPPDQGTPADAAAVQSPRPHSGDHAILVRVADVDRHHERAAQAGAHILHPPTDYPYGERQYVAEDLGGHQWTFSQSIADVDPATWGGTLKNASAAPTQAEQN